MKKYIIQASDGRYLNSKVNEAYCLVTDIDDAYRFASIKSAKKVIDENYVNSEICSYNWRWFDSQDPTGALKKQAKTNVKLLRAKLTVIEVTIIEKHKSIGELG